MKPVTGREDGFTRVELAVVLATIAVLAGMLLVPASNNSQAKVWRVSCVNNLKQIGIAYRVWANDNGDRYPSDVAQTNGGWRDLLGLPNVGTYAWTNFALMASEMGNSPSILICPADERRPANSCSNLDNTHISYLTGVGADNARPQAILGGDR